MAGLFYPEGFSTSKMLAYYMERFTTVEINNTFYKLPTEKTLTDLAAAAPPGFTFTLKAPQAITRRAQLKDSAELVNVFTSRAALMGPKLGILLFQLPPWGKKNLEVFDTFLTWLPQGTRAAFEFRNASWLSDDVFERLKARNLALCITDSEKATTPLEATADYGYFRLRDEGYTEPEIQAWGDKVAALTSRWKDTYVYFKHEEAGKGPLFANVLKRHLGLG